MKYLRLKEGLLQFDGEVVELFNEKGGSNRYHILYIQKIVLEKGKRGITLITLRYGKSGGSGFSSWIIPSEHVEQAHQFIDAIFNAKDKYII